MWLALCTVHTTHAQRAAIDFDVVSVKTDRSEGDSIIRTNPGRVGASRATLRFLLETAFELRDEELQGGPRWFNGERFSIDAVSSQAISERIVLLRMLQPVLVDRFKLIMHREMKRLPVYVISKGAGVLKITPTKPGEVTSVRVRPTTVSGETRVQITAENVSMAYLSRYLSRQLGRLVNDQTGIHDDFDFESRFLIQAASQTTAAQDAPATFQQDIYLEMLRDLGFKIEARTDSVEVLIVDSASMPEAN